MKTVNSLIAIQVRFMIKNISLKLIENCSFPKFWNCIYVFRLSQEDDIGWVPYIEMTQSSRDYKYNIKGWDRQSSL